MEAVRGEGAGAAEGGGVDVGFIVLCGVSGVERVAGRRTEKVMFECAP